MTTTHGETVVYVGARWQFNGTLLNANGTPMDITNKTVEWALLNKNRQPVLTTSGDVTITKTSAAQGLITIVVAKEKTQTVPVGRYTDYLRVNGEDILWTGQLIVTDSPFQAP